MKMNGRKYAEILGTGPVKRIALTNELNAPIEKVWSAITVVEQMQHWWPDRAV